MNIVIYPLLILLFLSGCSQMQKNEAVLVPTREEVKEIQTKVDTSSGTENTGALVNSVDEGSFSSAPEIIEPVPIIDTGGVNVTLVDEQGNNVDSRPLTQDEIDALKSNN